MTIMTRGDKKCKKVTLLLGAAALMAELSAIQLRLFY